MYKREPNSISHRLMSGSGGVDGRPLRLAIVVSHPIQYFSPLYSELARQPDLDLTVYYCERWGLEKSMDHGFGQEVKWDIPLLEGYQSQFLVNRSSAAKPGSFFGLYNPSILGELNRGRYDAVLVHGYNYLTDWLAFTYCLFNKIPILIRGESNLLHPRPLAVRAVKKLLLESLFHGISGFLFIGKANRDYYQHYGVTAKCLFHVPYVVNNEFWRQERKKWQSQRDVVRSQYGIASNQPVILFAGKLIDVKEPLLLLEAYRHVRSRHFCSLVFAGDGPLREEIERQISRQSIPDVHITGFLNQTELSKAYVMGDLFVLPSKKEPWGLVINEAMNFALPIVVTDRVGCAADLVEPEGNGAIVPTGDLHGLAKQIERLVMDSSLRKTWGNRSEAIISEWDLGGAAAAVAYAVRCLAQRN